MKVYSFKEFSELVSPSVKDEAERYYQEILLEEKDQETSDAEDAWGAFTWGVSAQGAREDTALTSKKEKKVSNYSGGVAFEREIINLLREAGFSVIRGAGSKGEWNGMKIDFIASKKSPTKEYELGVAVFQAKSKKRK